MPCLFPTDLDTPSDVLFPGCSPVVPQHILRISFDDPDTPEASRTYVSFEDRLRSWEIGGGRDSELDEYDATQGTYVLDDRDRELDPTNAASTYAPDVVPNRLLWHRVEVDSVVYDVFKGYIDGWGPDWLEHGGPDNRAVIRVTDGRKPLRSNTFESADPDVLDYPDVISPDEPAFYYRMGEPAGTKLVHHVKKKRKRREGETARHYRRHGYRHWTTRRTRAEAEGISGPSGSYKNTPLLGAPGLIKGDPSTAVEFRSAQLEYAIVPIEDNAAIDSNRLTLECWVKPTADTGKQPYVTGPYRAASSTPVFELFRNAADNAQFHLLFTDGSSISTGGMTIPLTVGSIYHLAGTWDGTDMLVYVNGVLDGTNGTAAGKTARPGDAGGNLYIGQDGGGGAAQYADAVMQDVAVYETALSADRVEAHYRAGLLGFDAATTGQRIEDILTLADVPGTWEIQGGQRTMPPARYAGVAPVDMIEEALAAEGEPAVFYFTTENNPRYLDSAYRSGAPYSAPRFSFGGSGTDFDDVRVDPDDSFLFNDIRGTREEGDKTFRAEDATSIGRFGRITLQLDSLPIDNDAELQTYVDDLLVRYKDPIVRIPAFTISGGDVDRRAAMMALELGDCVDLEVAVPGTPSTPLVQTSYIERRQLSQEQGSPVIRAEFSVSPR